MAKPILCHSALAAFLVSLLLVYADIQLKVEARRPKQLLIHRVAHMGIVQELARLALHCAICSLESMLGKACSILVDAVNDLGGIQGTDLSARRVNADSPVDASLVVIAGTAYGDLR